MQLGRVARKGVASAAQRKRYSVVFVSGEVYRVYCEWANVVDPIASVRTGMKFERASFAVWVATAELRLGFAPHALCVFYFLADVLCCMDDNMLDP